MHGGDHNKEEMGRGRGMGGLAHAHHIHTYILDYWCVRVSAHAHTTED